MIYHNPEGMSDYIGYACKIKKDAEQSLRSLFNRYGYMEIETPSLEPFDMYYGENEYINQSDIFKLTDRSGELLVLRPDMTVPACRVAASKIKYEKLPYFLSYISKCFRAEDFGGGKQREFTQCGAEIMGGADAYYDAYVIKTAIKSALELGLSDIAVSIGQVEFFNGLAEQAGLDAKQCEQLSVLIESKDTFSIQEFLQDHNIQKDVEKHLMDITGYFGGIDFIKSLSVENLNERSKKALTNLIDIHEMLKAFKLDSYVVFDLSMVKKLGYYTGMIFSGNTYHMGFPIFSGGRYDNLAGRMGRKLQASGFSLSLEMALKALERQKKMPIEEEQRTLLCYSKACKQQILSIVDVLQEQLGFIVIPDMDGCIEYAKERGFKKFIQCIDIDQVIVQDFESQNSYTFEQWRKLWNI